jgi:anti-sigma factor RsiW
MDHAEARELLELAAVEPDGFDRLAAGDTPESAMLAGHLAGCAECSAELERLRRSSELIRDAVRSTAPPELKQRTLAFVAAVGRDRTTLATGPVGAATAIPVAEPVSIEAARSRKPGGIGRLGWWAATVAAGIAIALVATQLLVVGPQNAQIADQQRAVNALAKAAAWTLQIQGEPNAEQVTLVSTSGDADLTGTITYAPGTDRLVVLAQGLEEPPTGTEYRCWVESGGQRVPIGQMFFAGDVAFWVGEVPDIGEVGEDVTFGVSPSPADNPKDVSADPVLKSEAG